MLVFQGGRGVGGGGGGKNGLCEPVPSVSLAFPLSES